MKRDMDLVRQILLAAEALPYGGQLQELPGVNEDEFITHAAWLQEAGLIHAQTSSGTGSMAKYAVVTGLTWAGTEFISALQDASLWSRAKEKFMRPGMSFTLDIVKSWLVDQITKGV